MEGYQRSCSDDNDTQFKYKIMCGDFDSSTNVGKKILRVFISSTFKDTLEERNFLMREIYPKIRDYCESRGLRFIPVDLRWGIGEHLLDDHRATDVCLAEVDRCFRQSIPGPCFFFLSFNRYGSQPLPRTIDAEEFETILKHIKDEETRGLVSSCYLLDTNALPAEYVLKSKEKQLEQFDLVEGRKAKEQCWSKKKQCVHNTIRRTVFNICDLGEEKISKWKVSVTENEVRRAICKQKDAANRCFAIKRDIVYHDKEKQSENADGIFKLFVDNFEENRKELRELMKKYQITVKEFTVPWADGGIREMSHCDYFAQFGEAFFGTMINMIEQAIRELPCVDPLTTEVAMHLSFCSSRAAAFYGRESLVTDGEQYFQKMNGGGNLFVIHGVSGSGKTSLTSKLAQTTHAYFTDAGRSPVLVVRFCGTTVDSSTAFLIMKTICQQIHIAYGVKDVEIPLEYEKLIGTFIKSMRYATRKRPLLIFIDSLDQLSNNNYGRSNLKWLPAVLPNHAYLVVTTVDKYGGCLENLQQKNLPSENYYHVAPLADEDCDLILDNWLKLAGRKLSAQQREYILSIAKDPTEEKPSTLRLRLLYQMSIECASYDTLENLPKKTVDLIWKYLHRVEGEYGALFVSTLFGLLDTSRRGLSENDLLDILSCNEAVVDEVLKGFMPPIRRIPQIVLSRLRNRLGEYVVERGAYGKPVLAWYHRQFWETAHKRYMRESMVDHSEAIRQFFSGELSEKYKDRNIAPQPLFWRHSKSDYTWFNEQKLQELPLATLRGEDPNLIEDVLCNFQFIGAKLKAGFAQDLLKDFNDAVKIVQSQKLEEYKKFLSSRMHVFVNFPDYMIQPALSYPKSSWIYKDAKQHSTNPTKLFPWLDQKKCFVRQISQPVGMQSDTMTFLCGNQRVTHLQGIGSNYLLLIWEGSNGIYVWDMVNYGFLDSLQYPSVVSAFKVFKTEVNDEESEFQVETDVCTACKDGNVYIDKLFIGISSIAQRICVLCPYNDNSEFVISYVQTLNKVLLATANSESTENAIKTHKRIKIWDDLYCNKTKMPQCVSSASFSEFPGEGSITSIAFLFNGECLFVCAQACSGKYTLSLLKTSTLKSFLQILDVSDASCKTAMQGSWPLLDVHETSETEVDLLIAFNCTSLLLSLVKEGVTDIRVKSLCKLDSGQAVFSEDFNYILTVSHIKVFIHENPLAASKELSSPITTDTLPGKNGENCQEQVINMQFNLQINCITPKKVGLFMDHGASVTAVTVLPGFVATGSLNGVVKVWDLEARVRENDIEIACPSQVKVCHVIQDERKTLTFGQKANCTLKIWDSYKGTLLDTISNVSCNFITGFPQSSTVCIGRGKGLIRLCIKENLLTNISPVSAPCGYDIYSGAQSLENPSVSSNGEYVAFLDNIKNKVYVINTVRKQWIELPFGHREGVVFLHEGVKLLTWRSTLSENPGTVLHVWDFEWKTSDHVQLTRDRLGRVEGRYNPNSDRGKKETTSMAALNNVKVTEAKIFDLNYFTVERESDGKTSKKKIGHESITLKLEEPVVLFDTSSITAVDLLPRTSLIAMCTETGELQIRDASNFALQRKVRAHEGKINIVQGTPDGLVLVTAGYDDWIRVWYACYLEEAGGFENGAPITSLDIFYGDCGCLYINFGDCRGLFEIIKIKIRRVGEPPNLLSYLQPEWMSGPTLSTTEQLLF